MRTTRSTNRDFGSIIVQTAQEAQACTYWAYTCNILLLDQESKILLKPLIPIQWRLKQNLLRSNQQSYISSTQAKNMYELSPAAKRGSPLYLAQEVHLYSIQYSFLAFIVTFENC